MTMGTPISRRSLGALLGVPFVARAAASDVWSALRAPEHLALIRHAAAPGTLDPPGFTLEDCSTQRNLSDGGRTQAIRMGDLFRANGIMAARIYSSQWCRCLDTATLMKLGNVIQQPLLNYFGRDPDRTMKQIADLRAWITGLELAQPTLLLTHQLVISTLVQGPTDDGEIVVVRRDTGGKLTVQGRQPTA